MQTAFSKMRKSILTQPDNARLRAYIQHFHNQKGGLINVYSGRPYQYVSGLSVYTGQQYQYGTGLGDMWASFSRSFLPIFGRVALKTGTTVVNKMLEGREQGKTMKQSALSSILPVLETVIDEAGPHIYKQVTGEEHPLFPTAGHGRKRKHRQTKKVYKGGKKRKITTKIGGRKKVKITIKTGGRKKHRKLKKNNYIGGRRKQRKSKKATAVNF